MTLREFFSPTWWLSFLHRVRYLHFFAVGITGVGINLGITVLLTEFVFGRTNYFSAYLIGLAANLFYNFVLHTIVTFKTTEGHIRRLVAFFAYSLVLAYIQARAVRYLSHVFGVDWYVVIITFVIFVFSTLTFVFFKSALFRTTSATSEA